MHICARLFLIHKITEGRQEKTNRRLYTMGQEEPVASSIRTGARASLGTRGANGFLKAGFLNPRQQTRKRRRAQAGAVPRCFQEEWGVQYVNDKM